MKTIQELQYEAQSILDLVKAENREMSADETKKFDDLMAEMDQVRGGKALENRIPVPVIDQLDNGGYRSLGEFLYSVADGMVHHEHPFDNRLNELRATQSMGEGTSGGFMVPTQFLPDLKSVSPQEAIVRPRATIIPPGEPPDAEVTIPVLNQTAAENVYGGVEVKWLGEGDTKNQTDFELKQKDLIPHEVAGYIDVTDRLLRNWPACEAVTGKLLKQAVIGAEDMAFLTGNGVGKPHGVIHSGAVISVARAVANQIAYSDIRDMLARFKFGGSPIWVASQTIIPQLMNIVDPGAAGTLIWNMDAKNPMPGTIMGIPLKFNDRSPALGTLGDFCLLDLQYYLIKDGSGPFVAASPHVHWRENKTCIKIFWNVDGDSWLDEALPLEGSTANTVSPFITLAE
jgi:HK97 family phage major capsid protein